MNQIATKFASIPVLIACERSQWLTSALAAVEEKAENIPFNVLAAVSDFWGLDDDWSFLRPYNVVDGILMIPVLGVLLSGFPYQLGSWATGYEYIWEAYKRGMEDSDVVGIAFVIDSGGGEVSGNFDTVDRMFAMRGNKPVAAFINEHAYSAAYSIASVADQGRIYVPRTGGAGSIGVLTSHLDLSESLKKNGIKITLIHGGSHKVDGNPYEALPDSVKARMQARIDQLYSIFVSTVARNRNLTEDAVRGTEALTYGAEEAVENGLADKVMALPEAIADFTRELNQQPGDEDMPKDNEGTQQEPKAFHQADVDAARKEGMTAANERIKAIIGHEKAEGKSKLAQHLAFNTDLTVDAAVATLEASAAEAPAPSKAEGAKPDSLATAFQHVMGQNNPEVGDDAAALAEDTDTAAATVATIVGDYNKATGKAAK